MLLCGKWEIYLAPCHCNTIIFDRSLREGGRSQEREREREREREGGGEREGRERERREGERERDGGGGGGGEGDKCGAHTNFYHFTLFPAMFNYARYHSPKLILHAVSDKAHDLLLVSSHQSEHSVIVHNQFSP